MGTLPKALHLKAGALVVSAPMTPSAPPVVVKLGDAVVHPSGAGWHVCTVQVGTTPVPVGGLPLGQSSDAFHWSQGASYSGAGVPCSYSPTSYDQGQTGYGTDGRISGSGATSKPAF